MHHCDTLTALECHVLFIIIIIIYGLCLAKNVTEQGFAKSAPRSGQWSARLAEVVQKNNSLCFADHRIILSGPRTGTI